MEFWLIFAYALGTLVGLFIGGKIAYRLASEKAVLHTVDLLITAGYLRAHPPGPDGSQQLIKFDER